MQTTNESGLKPRMLYTWADLYEKQLVAGAPLRETLVAEAKKTEKPTENSWYNWLVTDLMANGETNNGIDPKSRPRSYNEGPRE